MKKYIKIIFASVIFIISLIVFCLSLFRYELSPVSKDTTEKIVIIKEGTISSIGMTLKKENLIRSELFFKLYIRLTNKNSLQAGTYSLNESMSTKEIIKKIEQGKVTNKDEIKITFKEGKNIRYIAKVISENTNNNESDVFNLIKDNNYLNELINNYWFIENDITKKDIYYPLEGYLFPDTYIFKNKDVEVKKIFKTMLDEMDKKLSIYKTEIERNNLSIHELLTLASIVELEGAKANDRKEVAGVFYNRLNNNWSLGSDVTTYYASKIDDWSYSLTYKELNDCNNKYNTRCKSFIGLPIGPIANVSIESLDAVFNYSKHNYYYFVADCNGKVYLTKNESEHNKIINKLKEDGNWCA